MTLNFKKIRFLILIILGLLFLFRFYRIFYISSFQDRLILISIGLIEILIFIWILIKDYKGFSWLKRMTGFPAIIVFVVLLSFLGFNLVKYYKYKSPTLLKASSYGLLDKTIIDFKVNGNYILINSDLFGDTYLYGTYFLLDSIIEIDKRNKDNFIKTSKFKISSGNSLIDKNTVSKKYLFQLDNKGKTLDLGGFEVEIDNRNDKK